MCLRRAVARLVSNFLVWRPAFPTVGERKRITFSQLITVAFGETDRRLKCRSKFYQKAERQQGGVADFLGNFWRAASG